MTTLSTKFSQQTLTKWVANRGGGAGTTVVLVPLGLSSSAYPLILIFRRSAPLHVHAESSERGQRGVHVGCRSNCFCRRSGARERRAGKGDPNSNNFIVRICIGIIFAGRITSIKIFFWFNAVHMSSTPRELCGSTLYQYTTLLPGTLKFPSHGKYI